MDIVEDLEKKYKELGEEIEKLKNEKKTSKCTPEIEEKYYIVNDVGDVELSHWYDDEADKYRRDFLKIFKTKEEAEEYLEFIKAKKECSHEFTQEEWKYENIKKYTYHYNYEYKEIYEEARWFSKSEGQTYFKTSEDRDNFIKKYEKQILKYDFGIENV